MTDWKQEFANEAEKAAEHPLVLEACEEFCRNVGIRFDGLRYIGLMKIAQYAATIARAQALDVDVDSLRVTPDEHNDLQLEYLRTFRERGS